MIFISSIVKLLQNRDFKSYMYRLITELSNWPEENTTWIIEINVLHDGEFWVGKSCYIYDVRSLMYNPTLNTCELKQVANILLLKPQP